MVGVTLAFFSARISRQKPTRMPYSYQVQFGMSGMTLWPCGAIESCRAIGRVISHSSMLTTDQMMMRPLPGSFSGGRVNGDEYEKRSRGEVVMQAPGVSGLMTAE